MMTIIISYHVQMNFVVTLLQEQHQCIDDDDMGDDHNHSYDHVLLCYDVLRYVMLAVL